jgi:hypothetical protein
VSKGSKRQEPYPDFEITRSRVNGRDTGVRLSDAYRAIYIIHSDGRVEAVYVEEVNKHDY